MSQLADFFQLGWGRGTIIQGRERLVKSADMRHPRLGRARLGAGLLGVARAPGDDGGRGSIYVCERSGDSWTNSAKLTVPDAAVNDHLGTSVAIDGDTIVAGCVFDDVGANADAGSVHTFARSGTTSRTQTAKLTASGAGSHDDLGTSVAIDGDMIVAVGVGADANGVVNAGAIYTFSSAGAAARTESAKLTASDAAANDFLNSVAIDGDTIVAGVFRDAVGANADQGSVYTFAVLGRAPVRRSRS